MYNTSNTYCLTLPIQTLVDISCQLTHTCKFNPFCYLLSRNYIDQLEQPGGKQFNIQNFMMMYILGSTNNTEYRTKLFDQWPTVSSFNSPRPS